VLNFFFSFNGRVRRTNFFFGALVTNVIAWSFGIHWLHMSHFRWVYDYDAFDYVAWPVSPGFFLVGSIIALGCFWAGLALTAKRWHDAGASGWLTLLSFIPGVHFLIFLLLCLLPPTRGDNQYGADPRTGAAAYA
jgi:uncharacterized membrane protein YhaH (DUF805 family)